jgi:hypothetical protein
MITLGILGLAVLLLKRVDTWDFLDKFGFVLGVIGLIFLLVARGL